MDTDEKIRELRARIEMLEAHQVAATIVMAALLEKSTNYNAVQLRLTSLLEQQLAGGALTKHLSEAQKTVVRDHVEELQALTPKP